MPATIHDSYSDYDDDEHIIREHIPISKSKPDPVVEKEFIEINSLLKTIEDLHRENRKNRDETERLRVRICELEHKINSLR
jgi:hypothetical protein